MSSTTSEHRRGHHDSPDTDEDFRRLRRMPPGPERDRLRQRIICAWLPVAERLARGFRDKGESLDDLTQVAALALVNAVDRYDPDRGHAFASFAVPTVVGEIKRHFRDHLWTLHVPRRIQELRARTRAARHELEQRQAGRAPSVRDVAAYTGLTEEEVRLGMEADASCEALSLDGPVGGVDGRPPVDTLGAEDPAIDLVVHRESLKPLIAGLSEVDRLILYLRFFEELTQSQIGALMGVSQMQVSRTLARLCRQLRQGLLAPV
ncbi:SigB/SigF/SigG family RNA polymerase sigma factor [Streptomyces sp. URMC 123]|uniref:SigB/SigF/SigG family RNA polymerase sigma factor n=1 Tax=Streptomyces sp. URMC 123 TaxID=3423403 RepID=UPI003F1CF47E